MEAKRKLLLVLSWKKKKKKIEREEGAYDD